MALQRAFIPLSFMLSVMLLLLLAITPSWGALQCGDTIGPNQVGVLTEDLTCPSDDPALTVMGPKAVLKLGGHTVDCDDAQSTGILLNGSGAILTGGPLKNGTVTGCEFGIKVGGKGGHRIKKVTATQNTTGFVLIGGSHGNRLTYNTSQDNELGGFSCLLPCPNHDNEFSWNTSKNDFFAFAMLGDRNIFKYNEAVNYQTNSAGYLIEGNDNMVTRNRALGGQTGFSGFMFRNGERNTVSKNLAKDNIGSGFLLEGGSGFKVFLNRAKNNGSGIFLQSGAINTTLIGNLALDNGTDLADDNVDCDNNKWKFNWFKTSQTNPPDAACIR